ncbi:MAG: formate dehydrogenase accessory sulfurtransferase FdhD [Alphaproteobacteria bacterium]
MTATRMPICLSPDHLYRPTNRPLAAERPVSITYNGESYAVMMVSPQDLEDFAVGFSISEGIVESKNEIVAILDDEIDDGLLLHLEIIPDRLAALSERKRSLIGQTGCGLCGVTDLHEAVRTYTPIESAPHLSINSIFTSLQALPNQQILNQATGAVHAAAFADNKGTICAIREDVGRHNAFDKLIGDLARTGIDPASGFAVLTSRCSIELVQKALAFRIPALITISAPTDLAVDVATDHSLTLVALAREDGVICFNDPFGIFA